MEAIPMEWAARSPVLL